MRMKDETELMTDFVGLSPLIEMYTFHMALILLPQENTSQKTPLNTANCPIGLPATARSISTDTSVWSSNGFKNFTPKEEEEISSHHTTLPPLSLVSHQR